MIFQFYPVCNLRKFITFGLDTIRIERVKRMFNRLNDANRTSFRFLCLTEGQGSWLGVRTDIDKQFSCRQYLQAVRFPIINRFSFSYRLLVTDYTQTANIISSSCRQPQEAILFQSKVAAVNPQHILISLCLILSV